MKMEDLEKRYEVARWMSAEAAGVATEEELAQLREWREAEEEHEREWRDIRSRLAEELRDGRRVDRERGWRKVAGRLVWTGEGVTERLEEMGEEVKGNGSGEMRGGEVVGMRGCGDGRSVGMGEGGIGVRRVDWRRRLVWVAACAAVMAGVTVGMWRVMVPMAELVGMPERAGGAVLVLGNGERVVLDGGESGVVRESEAARITVEGRTVRYEERDGGATEMNVLEIPRGAEYELVLADGTRVWVNSESRLRYPTRFAGNVRQVEMEGEVCFDVARMEDCPFTVKAKGTEVRVLGTLFNVESYAGEDAVRTTLVRGKVEVATGKERVVLEPDRQAVADREGRIAVREVYGDEFVAWTKGEFRFRRQELKHIMVRLARWYNVEVFYANPALKEVRFTLNTKRYEDIGDILSKIEGTGRVHFRVKGRTVIVE